MAAMEARLNGTSRLDVRNARGGSRSRLAGGFGRFLDASLLLVLALDGYQVRLPGLRAIPELALGLGLVLSVARDVEEIWGRLDRWAAARTHAAGWLLLALVVLVAASAGHGLLLRLAVALRQAVVVPKSRQPPPRA